MISTFYDYFYFVHHAKIVQQTIFHATKLRGLQGDNLLIYQMFISKLGLGLRDTTPQFERVLHYSFPPFLTCCHW